MIQKRNYRSYNKYIEHQKRKLNKIYDKKISSYSQEVKGFVRQFTKFSGWFSAKILCLAPRLGAEVEALHRMGHKDAIGIDLNIGKDPKPFMIEGDFHNMPFKKNSFDTIYTNSIDHCFDIARLSQEVSRVLKTKGKLLIELGHSLMSKKKRMMLIKEPRYRKFESIMWEYASDIEKAFSGRFGRQDKFKIKSRRTIIVFSKNS